MQALERAILAHDPGLAVARPASDSAGDISRRVVLVVPSSDERIDELLSIAAPLGRAPGCELIIARLLAEESELEPAASALTARRRSLGLSARTAAYTAHDLPRETARLATNYDAELVLLDLPQRLEGNRLPDELAAILERSPAHRLGPLRRRRRVRSVRRQRARLVGAGARRLARPLDKSSAPAHRFERDSRCRA